MKPSKTTVGTKQALTVTIVVINVKKKMYIRIIWSISMPMPTSAKHAERISTF